MKKAIIILTILTLLLIGLTIYLGKGYIDVLNNFNNKTKEKSALLDKQIELENDLELSKYQYNYDIQNLLDTNKGCKAWERLNETLKQINK